MAFKKEVKKFQMTIDLDSYEKLKVVADENQRSVVGQVAYWIYGNIAKYENEHGKINLVVQNNNGNVFANQGDNYNFGV